MYAKTIKYTDYNGDEKTKTFYFNLTKTELTKMQLENNGGLKEIIKKMVNEDDNKKIIKLFEDIVLGAYGVKSADGESFVKNDSVRESFQCHPAYDVLFMQFIQGGEKAMSDFINAIIPQDWSEEFNKSASETRKEVQDILNPQPN